MKPRSPLSYVRYTCIGIAVLCCVTVFVNWNAGSISHYGRSAAALLCLLVASLISTFPRLHNFRFTCWIIAAFVAAMIDPERFLHLGHLDLRHPWLILAIVQLVMFGMGTQMHLSDLAGVARMPYALCVGLLCQFTIMPLVGFGLARLFQLPAEVAAGVVLIGSCSSGLASNVMVYLAKGNLALSITLTTVATLLAPLMTPLWMKLLAGEMIEVQFLKMMVDIIKIVIVPIGAAMLHDGLKQASLPTTRRWQVTALIGAIGIGLLFSFRKDISSHFPQIATWLNLGGFLVASVVVGVAYHWLVGLWPVCERWMPALSMGGIVYFTAVTTAAGRNALLEIGAWLFLAAMLHNGLGYCFGYSLSRIMGLDVLSARTVALEVGLQNGGMASGLAGSMGKLGTVGLASAIFSPWMNVTGSILANYWRRHPVRSEHSGP